MELIILILIVVLISAAMTSRNEAKVVQPPLEYPMGPFEIRTIRSTIGDDGEGPGVILIEGRGLMPVNKSTKIGFVTSVFDRGADGSHEPVLSTHESFQESDSPVFQHTAEAGVAGPSQGFGEWVRVGMVIPELLIPPHRGSRELVIALRIIDLHDSPPIVHGFGDGEHSGMLGLLTAPIEGFTYDEVGWQDAAAGRDEARELAVRAAIAVAMADGSLDDSEGETIRDWIERVLDLYSDEQQKDLKQRLNSALRNAYEQARSGELTLSAVTERLNEIAPTPQKLEAVQLCVDVMAADGVMDQSELDLIHAVADALEIDYDRLDSMKRSAISGIDLGQSEGSAESILGIRPEWETKEKLKHLRAEFAKWNNQMTVLSPGPERDKAQTMLDMIAALRKKYKADV